MPQNYMAQTQSQPRVYEASEQSDGPHGNQQPVPGFSHALSLYDYEWSPDNELASPRLGYNSPELQSLSHADAKPFSPQAYAAEQNVNYTISTRQYSPSDHEPSISGYMQAPPKKPRAQIYHSNMHQEQVKMQAQAPPNVGYGAYSSDYLQVTAQFGRFTESFYDFPLIQTHAYSQSFSNYSGQESQNGYNNNTMNGNQPNDGQNFNGTLPGQMQGQFPAFGSHRDLTIIYQVQGTAGQQPTPSYSSSPNTLNNTRISHNEVHSSGNRSQSVNNTQLARPSSHYPSDAQELSIRWCTSGLLPLKTSSES